MVRNLLADLRDGARCNAPAHFNVEHHLQMAQTIAKST